MSRDGEPVGSGDDPAVLCITRLEAEYLAGVVGHAVHMNLRAGSYGTAKRRMPLLIKLQEAAQTPEPEDG